jgi:hypothetical protein
MKSSKQIPVRLFVTTPEEVVSIDTEMGERHLPTGPLAEGSEFDLRYGPYLEAVRGLVMRDNCRKILGALARRLERVVDLDEIEWLEIRTEKHGGCYHVAHVDFKVAGETISFAVNVAASQQARAQLERDFRLLRKLERRYRFPYLPQVYFKAAERYREGGKTIRWLHAFVAEWFEGYHEFHLHRGISEDPCRLLLWDQDQGYRYLSTDQELELYRQASRILTAYYDWNSFRQIYPWHHAAGDFVLKEEEGRVDLRLVTVRDYAPVVDFKTRKRAGKLLALLLFFLHLTIQMRLDRLDGVGEVVWAGDHCLEGVVAGFMQGLTERDSRMRGSMPPAPEVQNLFCRFSNEELMQLLSEMLDSYEFAGEELSHIRDQGEAHIEHLMQVMATFGKKRSQRSLTA